MGFSNIQAVDIIPECCNYVYQNFNIDVKNEDVFDFFRNSDQKWDLIIAFDVIEHFNKSEIVSLLSISMKNLKITVKS